MLANPPSGWSGSRKRALSSERNMTSKGIGGRFGAGLPRINDGSLLFLQHMISKMKDPEGRRHPPGHRLQRLPALHRVLPGQERATSASGSSKTTGWRPSSPCRTSSSTTPASAPTSGWSPTGRRTRRRGKIQLINAARFFVKMRKSLGNKRNEIGDGGNGKPDHIAEITRLYGEFQEGEHVKIFDKADFGYRRITVERPLRLNFAVNDERLERVQDAAPFRLLPPAKSARTPPLPKPK